MKSTINLKVINYKLTEIIETFNYKNINGIDRYVSSELRTPLSEPHVVFAER